MEGAAAKSWAEQLHAWAIPQEILDAAPESPYGFPVGMFGVRDSATTPSRRRALEALDAGATVVDVGVGGGAASIPLAPPAALVVGVDQSEAMLGSFAAEADRRDVAHREHLGAWPDVADEVPIGDVVVCHHVFYNVADLVPFVVALTAHARRRVVVELTGRHPEALFAPLWRRFHGVERPRRPTADDAVALLREMGLDVGVERFTGPSRWACGDRGASVAFARRRLCLPAEREGEVEAALAELGDLRSQALATLWWDAA